jgi:hypothetical protein
MCPPSSPSGAERPSAGSGATAGPELDPERTWRESFDALERAIGRPLEAFLASDEFADAAASFFKANPMLMAGSQADASWLPEMWMLPPASGIEQLRRAVEDLGATLRAMLDRLDAIEGRLGERD